ncbi:MULTISPECIES: hypothetical protein [Nonlabens]|uniref:Lacal_2735 family protein n=1 Tax=Nonlabens agnitus TaxID=870484 RepID=A0A2S9WRJ0_9FLAO|nr:MULTISPECIES: hypothetical protein [Nonlabens]KQC33198.1 hypothetical protein AAU57_07640 [Nonlabens sp. YIK11]PRP66075.1 hypothetical protein BST86_02725 [Nonlabens agnitus]
MTDIEIEQAEKTLNLKEKRYCNLMRKSFEISLKDRERAARIHDKAKALYEEITSTRKALNMELS